ncbi:hypothetical protein Q31b_53220 [Novipirellula aureliae]|uniref:Uncharacterized protein n=1 Tax=Novipirellula aureliae TaxID=2527966 RepID=A0A5C6DJX8_9BACT|nr:hypothetical protein Q31b_53220 [Novipirellula aureliae]
MITDPISGEIGYPETYNRDAYAFHDRSLGLPTGLLPPP